MAAALRRRLLAGGNKRGSEYGLRRGRNLDGRKVETATARAKRAMNFAVRRMRGQIRRRKRPVSAVQAESNAVSDIIRWREEMAGRDTRKGDMENEQIGGEPARQLAPTRLVPVICSRHAPSSLFLIIIFERRTEMPMLWQFNAVVPLLAPIGPADRVR